MSAMRLVVAGASGRMGRTLIRLIAETPDVALVGALEHDGSPEIGRDAGETAGIGPLGIPITTDLGVIAGADGVVDFTTPAATAALAAASASAGAVHVIGTTGLSATEDASIADAATRTVVVQSGNMSLGVNLLARLVRDAAAALDADFDIEITEFHHRHKVDAPSGTALLLADAAAEGRGIDLASHAVRTRDGQVGPRRRGDIGFSVLRGGSVVGQHTVTFAGEGELIELSHQAFDRAIFARGALKAALWGRGRPPGRYGMADVVGRSEAV
ncbi:MAG: 4-hydroxy-tetrahydrodipicolinate reductase [Bauldia sp.]